MTAADSRYLTDNEADQLDRLDSFARFLDAGFRLPGTGIRFGWDAIIGLIPGIGDFGTALIGLYFPYRAVRMGAGVGVVARMLLNIVLDWVIGTVPLLGDLFDIGFKCHQRNARLLREALQRR